MGSNCNPSGGLFSIIVSGTQKGSSLGGACIQVTKSSRPPSRPAGPSHCERPYTSTGEGSLVRKENLKGSIESFLLIYSFRWNEGIRFIVY